MKEAVLQRIIDVFRTKSDSETQFAKMIGANQKTINQQFKKERSLSLDTVLGILRSFEDISAEWLLRGEGEMYKTQSENSSMAANMQTMYEFLLEERDRKIREMEAELYLYKTQHPQKKKGA